MACTISLKKTIAIVNKSKELGVTFFDTASNYGEGASEIRLGKALKYFERDKTVINTKFSHAVTGDIYFNAKYIREPFEGILKR